MPHRKTKRTILVTDSGLGGMSVFAKIAAHLVKKSPWQEVSMIYFNAWPEPDKGYNHFETMNQRAGIFNNALNTMEKFHPDMILIACNTLSVIYPFTLYSHTPATRVSGIVEDGVQLIYEHLMADPDSQVILFGTPTTIAEKTHQKKLAEMGIDPDRITSQGCTNLAGKIERDPFSNDVSQMIHTNVSAAVSKMNIVSKKIYAALCCTHFGYRKALFYKALSRHLTGTVTLLDPNQKMVDHVIKDQMGEPPEKNPRFSPDMDMKVVSRVFWDDKRIDAYTKLLENISPEAVKALAGYEWNPDLFDLCD